MSAVCAAGLAIIYLLPRVTRAVPSALDAASFDLQHAVPQVVIDLIHAHFWDLSAVGALEQVTEKLRRHGANVEVIGLNDASQTLIDRVGRPSGSASLH